MFALRMPRGSMCISIGTQSNNSRIHRKLAKICLGSHNSLANRLQQAESWNEIRKLFISVSFVFEVGYLIRPVSAPLFAELFVTNPSLFNLMFSKGNNLYISNKTVFSVHLIP